MKKFLIAAVILAILGLAAALGYLYFATSAPAAVVAEGGEEYRFKAIPVVSAYIALVERPEAKRVLLADEGAEKLADIFTRAGKLVFRKESIGVFDTVVVTDPDRRDWQELAARAGTGALFVWLLDVRKTTLAGFKDELDSFPFKMTHFWMPGETDWVLAGSADAREVELEDMLELFTVEDAFRDLATGSIDTVAEVFASFAGTRESILPAFTGNIEAGVRSEYFLTREIPDIPWIVSDDVDGEVLEKTAAEVRSMQVVRRNVIEGNILSREGRADEAVGKWHAAALRNPHDTMLLDRLYRLAVTARTFQKVGNFKAAAKSLETMISIRPTDAAAIEEYAAMMRQLGEKELAAAALKRAKELKEPKK